MKFRTLLSTTVGSAGVTAAVNRLLTRRAGDLRPALTGSYGIYRWRGFDVAYTEAGDPDDPDLVLLHGIHAAASSQEFEQVFDMLAEDFHVLAPDLPGFGRSDRPPISYTAPLYAAFVSDFAADLTTDAACVASSLTASFAAIAQQERSVFSRLILVCPTAETTTDDRRPWLQLLLKSPLVGTALFNLLVSKPSLRWFSARDAYYSPSSVTEHEIEYDWQTAHQPNARFAPASFVSGYLDPDVDLGATLASLDVPVTLVWGREATFTPLIDGKELANRADTRLVVVDETRLLPHAEHPGPFLDILLDELVLAEH